MFDAILFDLDGTLADTAPDLGGTVNWLRAEAGLPALPLAELRPYTSQGVRGLLKAGFGMTSEHPDYADYSRRFLEHYAANLCVQTTLFAGMEELLARIENAGLAWGVVTNKRSNFSEPLLTALGLAERATTIVSGDTTAETKPSPLPILHACRETGCAPQRTLYVGDDRRDVDAGRAAGTRTAVVAFGYLGDGGPIEHWGADFLAEDTEALARYIFTCR